jgi:hypothetical protein
MTAFVDSNILICAHDLDAGLKRERAAATLCELWDAGTGRLSVQVLQEFYVNATGRDSGIHHTGQPCHALRAGRWGGVSDAFAARVAGAGRGIAVDVASSPCGVRKLRPEEEECASGRARPDCSAPGFSGRRLVESQAIKNSIIRQL